MWLIKIIRQSKQLDSKPLRTQKWWVCVSLVWIYGCDIDK